ncbi:hypothetical protein [Labilibacter marinus]|uniref:hypothetical protein n=1 Tax=Labilibacter marinus TaxID=1477105 RepID=UPI00094FD83D|nr:hypothetical protein [Labilibacter marinus]
MPGFHKLKDHSSSPHSEGAVGYWIYNVKDDVLNLSEGIKKSLGLEQCTSFAFSSFKSLIVGADVPTFVKTFNEWINGNSSPIAQIRIVDSNNEIRLVQIKGRLRSDIRNEEMVLYGAYIDISYWSN